MKPRGLYQRADKLSKCPAVVQARGASGPEIASDSDKGPLPGLLLLREMSEFSHFLKCRTQEASCPAQDLLGQVEMSLSGHDLQGAFSKGLGRAQGENPNHFSSFPAGWTLFPFRKQWAHLYSDISKKQCIFIRENSKNMSR